MFQNLMDSLVQTVEELWWLKHMNVKGYRASDYSILLVENRQLIPTRGEWRLGLSMAVGLTVTLRPW